MPAISLKETRVRTWALFDKIAAIKIYELVKITDRWTI